MFWLLLLCRLLDHLANPPPCAFVLLPSPDDAAPFAFDALALDVSDGVPAPPALDDAAPPVLDPAAASPVLAVTSSVLG